VLTIVGARDRRHDGAAMSGHLAVILEHVVPTFFVEHDLSAVRIRGRGEDRGRH